MLDLSSSSLSFASRSVRLCAVMILALSTTRPVSGGKSSASTKEARQRASPARTQACRFTIAPLELHLRRRCRTGSCGEFRHWFFAREGRFCPDDCRECPQRRVKGAYRVDIIAPCHRNAVLGPFELRLQSNEIGIGFEIGIVLRHRQQSAERPSQLRLSVLKGFDLVRVGEIGGINLYLRRLGTRFDHAGKHALLLRSIALDS